MQPVVFSVTEAKNGHSGWIRNSTEVSYFPNEYSPTVIESEKEGSPEKRRRASTGSVKVRKKSLDETKDSEEIK